MVFICRLCGKCENESSGLAIFGEEGVKEALAYKVKLSLDISVSGIFPFNSLFINSYYTSHLIQIVYWVYEYDPLPKYICKACLGKLFYTYSFQESCRRTQILLRERFLRSKNWSVSIGILITSYTYLFPVQNSCNYTPSVATSGTQEEISRPPEQELVIETALPETNQQQSDNVLYPESNDTPCSPKETSDIFVKEEHVIDVTKSCTQQNGVIDEIANAVGSKQRKRGEPKKRGPRNNGSAKRICKKKRDANSAFQSFTISDMGHGMPQHVSNVAENQQGIDSPPPITIESVQGAVSEISGSHTNSCVQNLDECVRMHEVQEPVERADVYIGPDIYEAPLQPISVGENIIPSVMTSDHSEDLSSRCNNALKIVDVFSVQESSNASSSSNVNNWHSPSSLSNPSNSFESQNLNNTANWHSPAPASSCSPTFLQTSQNTTSKKNTSAAPTLDTPEEEDILVLEVVKANKGSIAQHWEKCTSGYKCKICKKSYKKLIKCENHIRNHLGIKPYECDICKRRRFVCNCSRHLQWSGVQGRKTLLGIPEATDPVASCAGVFIVQLAGRGLLSLQSEFAAPVLGSILLL
ncbi:hypothetical protein ANN_18406 [Periplaneta americana]|uniref:ZAD domain-containing protein n=1 Tax=Periplaneta americana TaxID=6978 RepID=A0ABQ8SQ50_PERAM|nr:hypothetical protein ANN_18406 [Periplaneta americana]